MTHRIVLFCMSGKCGYTPPPDDRKTEEGNTLSLSRNLMAAAICFFAASEIMLASSAFADDNPLLITVRKQKETLEKVPASVVVLNKDTLEEGSIHSPSQISMLVPGFSFNDPFGRYNPAPSFRGLIQQGLGDDPSVGFFNDGMYLSGRSSVNSLNFDMERIEAVKGPQNALFGRNSFGGLINMVSAMPTDRLETWVDGRAGTQERFETQAGINLPVNDVLKSRLALYWRDWGGYFDNDVANGPDIGRERTKAARLSFLFDPSFDRDIILRLTYIKDDDGQPAGFLVPANCGPRIADSQLRLYCGEIPERSDYGYEANDVGTEQPMGYHREHMRANLEWKEYLASRTTLTTMMGASAETSVFIRDDDYQEANAARAGIDTDRFDTQFDMRINHKTADGLWNGLVGLSGYNFHNNVDRIDQYYVLGQTEPNGPKTKNVTQTAGLYGSLTRELGHGFSLTGDARYQYEQKTFNSTTTAVTTGQPLDLDDSWTAFTPKGTLSWTAVNRMMLYGSIAKGYKTGGFNDRANIFDSERTYKPEENITYEIGAKNIPLHDTLRADLGGFWIDWTDQQVIAYSTAGATQNFFINNAGQTTVKGIEAALRWQATSSLSLDVGYTYADARFDSYRDPELATISGYAPNGDVSGNRLPRYSPHHLSLNASYRKPSPFQGWDFVLGGQFTLQSSQYTDNSNTSKTGARTLLNLQGGVEKGPMTIGFWVDNALNEKDPAVGIPWTDAAQGFRREWLVVPQDGSTLGLRMTMKW